MRHRYFFLPVALSVGVFLITGCAPASPPLPATTTPETTAEETQPATLALTSAAFRHGEPFPQPYTCDGDDVSPPLSWDDPPAGTQSFALIMDDPDAPLGTWVHWVLFNLPAGARSLPQGIPAADRLPDGGLHGSNSWRRRAYGGPCPPSGAPHRYVFKLFALDTQLALEAGATREQVLDAMEGHVLARGELEGRYGR